MDINVGLSEEVLVSLNALAAKLGVTAEYLYGTLVAQVEVNAWSAVARLAITALTVALLLKVGCFLYRKHILNHDRENCPKCRKRPDDSIVYAHDWELQYGLGIALVIVMTIITIVAAYASVGPVFQLLNPEYYATKQLLAMLG